jgi:hypothetical protein
MTESKTLYWFRDNSMHTRGFTWAMNVHPRSEMVHRACRECGSVDHYPSGAFDVTVEGGTKYPDVLGCGAYSFLIVSARAVAVWQEAGVTAFHTYPVNVAEVKSKRLEASAAPQYYSVEIDGRCALDLAASGIGNVRICPGCQRVIAPPRMSSDIRFVLTPGSWDGTDLFRDITTYPRVSFCTDRILQLAGQHRLTNFRFEPMAGPIDPRSKGIDYLKRSHWSA